ncbi:NUDIX hydrolase [Vibrio sinensis]|nr:NUDIX domain-containing protein [Vibrio sinensis]
MLIDKLAWLHIENKKVLCVRSYGKTLFYVPGGKRDVGESDSEALIREIQEELSVELELQSLSLYGVFEAPADGKASGITVKATCYIGDYRGELKPASEIEELAWLGYSDIEQCSAVVKDLFEHLHQQGLIA